MKQIHVHLDGALHPRAGYLRRRDDDRADFSSSSSSSFAGGSFMHGVFFLDPDAWGWLQPRLLGALVALLHSKEQESLPKEEE